MKRKIYQLLLMTFFFLSSCKSLQDSEVLGCYESSNFEMTYSHLELMPNNKYFYYFTGDMSQVFYSGVWKIYGHSVFLNSFIQKKTIGRYYETKDVNQSDTLKLNLYDLINQELDSISNVYILQADSSYSLSRISKHLFVLNKPLDLTHSFVINTADEYCDFKISPKRHDSNVYTVYLVKRYRKFQKNIRLNFKDGTFRYKKNTVFKKVSCRR